MENEINHKLTDKLTHKLTRKQMLAELRLVFTPHLYKWMKTQFSDICSNGDRYINTFLDELDKFYNKKNICKLNIDMEYIEMQYIEYIYSFYIDSFMKDEDPFPFWAD